MDFIQTWYGGHNTRGHPPPLSHLQFSIANNTNMGVVRIYV